jgi:putative DNA methylase
MPYKKKLIEVALPLEDINREAAREKSIRHGHPSTLHLWWARRPLAACRAVLFASLVDDPSEHVSELLADPAKRCAAEKELKGRKRLWDERKVEFARASATGIKPPEPGPEPALEEVVAEQDRERLFDIIRDLVKWENSSNERVLDAARAEIMRSCDGKPPPVYDPFCGGGSIPLEAQRLGLEAHASDLNPIPVLINKALIEIPPKFADKAPVNPEAKRKLSASGSWRGAAGLAEDIRYYGQWMRDEAEERVGYLYPKVRLPNEHGGGEAAVIAWLWARTVTSPNPAAKGAHVPLVRSFWLSSKLGKKAWIEPVVDRNTMTYRFEVRTTEGEPGPGTMGKNGDFCVLTGSPMTREHIRTEGKAHRLGVRLMAIVAERSRGRIYLSPTDEQERAALAAPVPADVPETDIIGDMRYLTPVTYGMTKHRHLFTNRQLVALTTFSALSLEARKQVLADSGGDQAYADAIATYLGFACDRAADAWSSLASWRPTVGATRSTFARQALSMVWDFAEANPFSSSCGNWSDACLAWIEKAVRGLPAKGTAFVNQLNATELTPALNCLFSTDPPYYDNVPYADLSDFFYAWLRTNLQAVYPQLLGTLLVPKADELVADPFRQGGKEEARAFFEHGMSRVFERIRQKADPRFPTTIYYAFKQSEGEEEGDEGEQPDSTRTSTGWETFLQGFVETGWQVDGTWPLRTEKTGRTRELGSNALASSIVLVCRPRPNDAGVASRRDFLTALKKELPEALRHLQKGNIAPVDLAQAAIGPGIAVFSRYAKVMESDGSCMRVRAALGEINRCLDEVLAEQEGEFDGDTRWALAWFEQSGFGEGPYGTAETLSTAKNTSVKGLEDAGILYSKGGKVRLLRREELAPDWDPGADARFTIWEATHHLGRVLEAGGVDRAAQLASRLGSARSETARDLAYRLYSICERRKWAQDAIAYNNLVIAWPEITQAAGKLVETRPAQTDLNL